MVGSNCSYQLPKHNGGTAQIQANPTQLQDYQNQPVVDCFVVSRYASFLNRDTVQFLDINVPQVVLTEVVESERGANYIRNLHEVHAVFRRIKTSLEEESSSLDADERSRFQGTDYPYKIPH